MENYVKVKVNSGTGGSSEFKTKIIAGEKDKKIEWNETFSVPIKPNANSSFEFTVLDEDMTSDDICGKGLFKPDRCAVFNYGAAQTYNIRLVNGPSDEIAGELHLTTRYV